MLAVVLIIVCKLYLFLFVITKALGEECFSLNKIRCYKNVWFKYQIHLHLPVCPHSFHSFIPLFSPYLYIFVLAFTFPPTFISLHSPEFWLVFTLALSLGAALGFQLICGKRKKKNCSIIVMHSTCLIDFIHNYRMAGASVNTPVGGLEVQVLFEGAGESLWQPPIHMWNHS